MDPWDPQAESVPFHYISTLQSSTLSPRNFAGEVVLSYVDEIYSNETSLKSSGQVTLLV